MKLTIIMTMLAVMQVSASALAQRITLTEQNASLEQVLRKVKTQSGYDLFFNSKAIEAAHPVTLSVRNATVEEVLKQAFEGQPFTYTIEMKTIVVRAPRRYVPEVTAVLQQRLQRVVTGIVTDETGQPLPGVSVRANGSGAQTATVANGRYTITTTRQDQTLLFTFLGYDTATVDIRTRRPHYNVQLKPSTSSIEDVVITGIFKKSNESFTGASTTVTGEELQRYGSRNLITSLRNIDPSFNIIESNAFGSNPNRMPEIQIRGNSNIPNVDELQDDTRQALNTPLIILDGFESTLQKLLDINENVVESITILKDASATAIYGSRGSNGVVVITTKAPLPGKLRISYRGTVNMESPDLSDYTLLNARDKLELERRAGYYNNARAESDLPLKRYYNYLLNEVNSGVETDWMALPLRNSIGTRHNLRLEGGEGNLRYAASAQLNDIQGVMKESGRRTFNGNIVLTYTYNKVRFRNDLQISENKSSESPYGSFGDYVEMNPYWRVYDADGNILKQVGYPGSLDYSGFWGSTLPANPLYDATLNTFDKSGYSEFTNNTQIEWRIIKGLTLRGQFGLTKSVHQSDRFRPADHTAFADYSEADIFRRGDYKYGVGNALRYDGSLNLQYSKTFQNKHTVFAGIDYNIRQSSRSDYTFLVEGFTNPNFDFPSMALQYQQDGKPAGSESLTRAVGLTGNVNYIYDNRYFIDASLRIDGSSQFVSQQRFAPFWSTGIGWNLHNEAFFEDVYWLNRLKLRGSVGITGSQNFSAYQALSTYGYYTDDRYYSWNGAYMLGLGNEDLRWQQAMKYNLGVDAEFFNQRIKLTADVYKETTQDLVSAVNLPASNGFPSYIANVGRMRNTGIETKLTGIVVNKPKEGWFWSISAAAIQNRNKVLETSQALKDAQQVIQNGTTRPGIMYVEGYSSNAIWVVPSIGIDPSNGKELYLGQDGQPTYIWDAANVRAFGTTDPDYQGNINTVLRYKSLSVHASFGYRFGAHEYNSTLVSRVESGNYKYNVDQRVYDSRWQNPGDQAAFKGLLITNPTFKTSRFVQEENTFRCQNVHLEYDFRRAKWIQKMGMSSLILSADMADVFYISSIRRERGTDYPFSKQFSLNLNVIF